MTELVDLGDSIRGERIAAEASEISTVRVARRSSAHKGQFVTLTHNAYCVIEMPLRWVSRKKGKS